LAQSERPPASLGSRACPQPLNISAFQESLEKSSNFNSSTNREPIEGELSKDAFKFFAENRSRTVVDDPDDRRPRPLNSSAIAALRESLVTSSSGSSQAKKLFESGLLTNEAVQVSTL
jgi:hypothetical protein